MKRRKAARTLLPGLGAFYGVGVYPTIYYVGAGGSDAAAGTTIGTRWASISKVNSTTFAPGNQILFAGGETFSGGITLGATDVGTISNPITLGSYGTGKAQINSGTTHGVSPYNCGGLRFDNLIFNGDATTSGKRGISIYTDLAGDVKLPGIEISNCEFKNYVGAGLEIGAFNGLTGFSSIRVTDCDFHDNGSAGFRIYGPGYVPVHNNVYIARNKFYTNRGIAGQASITGSGLVMGHVSNAVVEFNVAYGNGDLSTSTTGPVGIWAYSSTNTMMRFNESYGNKTGSLKDGGGMDIDGGCSYCTMEYNYTHDNDGPGLLLCQFPGASAMTGNIIRYNISQNDARKNSAGIDVYTASPETQANSLIYNNTVYVSVAASNPETESCIRFLGTVGYSSMRVFNNIFHSAGGPRLVALDATTGIKFENNLYYSSTGTYVFSVGATDYASLSAWRATGQEVVSAVNVGVQGDPLLSAPGTGGNLNDATLLPTLTMYKIGASSPARNAGQTHATLKDFFGVLVPQVSTRDIGAAVYT